MAISTEEKPKRALLRKVGGEACPILGHLGGQLFPAACLLLVLAGCATTPRVVTPAPAPIPQAMPAPAEAPCEKVLAFHCDKTNTDVWRLAGAPVDQAPLFFVAGLTIDADGAPNAYHKNRIGIDYLDNAREHPNAEPDAAKGAWVGVVVDEEGKPVVQGPNDPCPGYYISPTSLQDKTKALTDPRRYVDSTQVPYIVLPGGERGGAQLGDFAYVVNQANGNHAAAIFADNGPRGRIGEGSVRLAELLGIPSSPKNGGADSGVIMIVFPHSGDGMPRTVDEIAQEATRLLDTYGGFVRFEKCLKE